MTLHHEQCFISHMGAWLMEPRYLQQAVAAIKAGVWKASDPLSADRLAAVPSAYTGKVVRQGGESGPLLYTVTPDGVAVIPMVGPMMKGDSKYGGVNTVRTRQALRTAAADADVTAIMLHIDAPGGHVAGTMELADDVKAVGKLKPVAAHADDLIASAAYWVGSAAARLTINAIGEAGSIGVVGVLEDWSKAYEAAGVKVHVISTGDMKGAGTQGTEITAEELAYVQSLVDGMNEHFLAAVQKNRGMSAKKLATIADGRVFPAAKALELGLVDAVQPFEKALADLGKEGRTAANAARAKRASAMLDLDAIS